MKEVLPGVPKKHLCKAEIEKPSDSWCCSDKEQIIAADKTPLPIAADSNQGQVQIARRTPTMNNAIPQNSEKGRFSPYYPA